MILVHWIIVSLPTSLIKPLFNRFLVQVKEKLFTHMKEHFFPQWRGSHSVIFGNTWPSCSGEDLPGIDHPTSPADFLPPGCPPLRPLIPPLTAQRRVMAERWALGPALQVLVGQTLLIQTTEDKLKSRNARDENYLWLALCLTGLLSFPCVGAMMLLGISCCHSNSPWGPLRCFL